MSQPLTTIIADGSLRRITNAVYQIYGYDFCDYSPSSLSRRVMVTMNRTGSQGIEEFINRLVNDKTVFAVLLSNLSINVTSMFRDPSMYRYLKQKV